MLGEALILKRKKERQMIRGYFVDNDNGDQNGIREIRKPFEKCIKVLYEFVKNECKRNLFYVKAVINLR